MSSQSQTDKDFVFPFVNSDTSLPVGKDSTKTVVTSAGKVSMSTQASAGAVMTTMLDIFPSKFLWVLKALMSFH